MIDIECLLVGMDNDGDLNRGYSMDQNSLRNSVLKRNKSKKSYTNTVP